MSDTGWVCWTTAVNIFGYGTLGRTGLENLEPSEGRSEAMTQQRACCFLLVSPVLLENSPSLHGLSLSQHLDSTGLLDPGNETGESGPLENERAVIFKAYPH